MSRPAGRRRLRTLGPFWFFLLGNAYVLTAIAIALVLGAGRLSRPARHVMVQDPRGLAGRTPVRR
jgi:hypothetical protein